LSNFNGSDVLVISASLGASLNAGHEDNEAVKIEAVYMVGI
jgi:hypothetical protein